MPNGSAALVPVCHCPSDTGKGNWYDSAGSPYGFASVATEGGRSLTMIDNKQGIPPARLDNLAKQVVIFEIGGYLMALQGADKVPPEVYWHSSPEEPKFNLAFADGHVEMVEIESMQLATDRYAFTRDDPN